MRRFPISLVLLISILGFGCATRTGQPASPEKPDPHGPMFTRKCSGCHGLELVEQAHATKTNAEMRDILKKHKDMDGTNLTEQELKTFLELY
jgi:hypothetical protein